MAEPDLFRALADPTRRRVFERLAGEGELTVVALTRDAGVSQPAVSQHLAVLKAAGLVGERREGRCVHYRARPAALRPLVDWIAHYSAFWPESFDKLETLLREMDQ